MLAQPPLARGSWGVLVKSLKTDETLYALNAGKLMMPASNMKIVTLAAAAEKLGWDYRYDTRLFAAGAVEGGTLQGDLVVVGSGDPSLVAADGMADRVFADWAERLKQRGIRAISGRVIGDDNGFEERRSGMGWMWDDIPTEDSTGVGALKYNENAVRVTVSPGPAAGDCRRHQPLGRQQRPDDRQRGDDERRRHRDVDRHAPPAGQHDAGAARLDRARRRAVRPRRLGRQPDAVLRQRAPRRADRQRHRRARPGRRHRRCAGRAGDARHADRLVSVGAAVDAGRPADEDQPEPVRRNVPEDASRPGPASCRPPPRAGARRRRSSSAGACRPGALIQRDGSGLSRYDYVTPEALVTILTHVDRDPRLHGPFEASLPIAGRDGTLSNRMKDTPAEGNARAKTGSMANVRGLSGYVTSADGEPLVFSILANNFDTPPDTITKTADAIVVRLAQFSRR